MPGMEVLIQPLQRVIEVEPGANLLEALRGAQVPMSYSCMAGRCGTCRCRVVDGDVLDSGRAEQNPLDAQDSYVLACQTFLTEPCTIDIPEPDEVVVHPARIVKATVLAVETLTHDIKRVVLKPAKPIEFSPGQHAQAGVRVRPRAYLFDGRRCRMTRRSSFMSASSRVDAFLPTSPTS